MPVLILEQLIQLAYLYDTMLYFKDLEIAFIKR